MATLKDLPDPCVDCGGLVRGYRSGKLRCVDCDLTHKRKRHRDDKRRYRAENPEKVRIAYRNWQRQRLYGISPEEFEQMLFDQGGVCATCGTDNPGKQHWHVDHDHSTGRVRGVLCSRCNLALGNVLESIETLENMISYLKGPHYFEPELAHILREQGAQI